VGDVSFTPAEIAVISALLTALCTPLAILFTALRGSYLDRIKERGEALTEAQKRMDEFRPAIEHLTEAVREQSRLIERMVDRREASR
jgi:Mg2+/Co2+ transporter CorB